MSQPRPPVERTAYTVDEFCAAAAIGRTTFYREVRAGRIHLLKCGRSALVPATEAQAWLRRLAGAEAHA